MSETFDTVAGETTAPATSTTGRTLLTGLPEDTALFVRIQLRTNDNSSPWVTTSIHTRPHTVPARTPDVKVTGVEHVNSDTYKVTITDTGDRTWVNSTRWLRADGANVTAANTDQSGTGASNSHDYLLTLDGAHPVTVGAVYCYGDCSGAGDLGPVSATLTFTTAPPAPATNVVAVRTGDTTADVTWDSTGPAADRWHIRWSNGAGDTLDADVTGATHTFTLPATPFTDPGQVTIQGACARGK